MEVVYRQAGMVRSLDSLNYSDGTQYSIYTHASARTTAASRRWPPPPTRRRSRSSDWAGRRRGYDPVGLPDRPVVRYCSRPSTATYPLLDVDRSLHGDHRATWTTRPARDGWLADGERDEDADGLRTSTSARPA